MTERDKEKMTIATEIRAEMARQGTLIKDLASWTAYSRQAIRRKIITEESPLTIPDLYQIASLLKIEPEELITRSKNNLKKRIKNDLIKD